MEPTSIFKNKWFAKFAKKRGITDARLVEAIKDAEDGLIDAELGSGLFKLRVARDGQGKRSSYRALIAFKNSIVCIFLYGFSKSDVANISDEELTEYRAAAKYLLEQPKEVIERMVENGSLTKVDR